MATNQHNSQRRLRAGVVGVGGIAREHVKGYRAAGVDVVAICDIDPVVLEDRAEAWDIPTTYLDYERMLAESELDVVSISTPVSTHHPITLAAAKAGVHVLCEKPISLDLEKASEMIEACDRAGVTLMIGHQLRSAGAVAKAKQLIADGAIGDVTFVRLRQAHDWGGLDAVRPSFATRESGGGGTLLDNGCHLMDLARHLVGDVENVYTRMATLRWPIELEDTSLVSVRFKSGAIGSIENSWTATGWEEAFWVYGTRGSLEWTNRHQEPVLVHAFRESPATTWGETDVARVAFAGEAPHVRHVRAFVEAVRGERDIACTGEDGLEAVRMVLAAYDSAHAGREVALSDASVTLSEANA